MNKNVTLWLIAAVFLILTGCLIFGGVMIMLKWDFTKLSTDKYETNRYEISEVFSAISVDTDTAHVRFVPSEDGKCSVSCYEQKNRKHSVSVEDGALVITRVDTRKWYDYIGITFETPTVTVSLPREEYGALSVKVSTGTVDIARDFLFADLDVSGTTSDVTSYASVHGSVKIKTTTGKIRLDGISAGTVDLSVSTGGVTASGLTCGDLSIRVSTGKTKLSDVSCKSLSSKGSTGDLLLTNVIAEGRFSIQRSTGDVTFEGCDAAEISVKTDTGDVKGSLLSEKIFIIETDTGRKEVPATLSGGKCEITTDTGNVKITIG